MNDRDCMNFSRADFPDNFEFGTATSSYQIEGHAFGGCGQTQWDTFAATAASVSGWSMGISRP